MPEYVAGNIFMRVPHGFMKKDERVDSHSHHFDHVTLCLKGSILFQKLDGEKGNVVHSVKKSAYELMPWILTEKGVFHAITALEDHTSYVCIYSHRRADTEEVVEEYTGWQDAVD